jgi:NAD(P)-dependent dehydrogenase (short-subunit alcohol dehydrogenase family)
MSQPLRVFITGGTRGIGRAIALRFAREGATVCVAARTSPDLDRVVDEIRAAGGDGEACQANMRDHGSVEAAVFRAVDYCGGALDVVINNAGTFDVAAFDGTDMETWDRLVGVNLTGPVLTTMEALPALRESARAHIINIASVLARDPVPGTALYATTKAGLAGFSRGLRADLAPEGIRVTTVFPRATDTELVAPYKAQWAGVQFDAPEAVAEVVWRVWQADEAPEEVFVGEGPLG